MTVIDVFGQHIDDPAGTRHRCVLTDPRHLRCLDCRRTLVLPTGLAATGSTSTSGSPANLNDPNACPQHVGERVGTCGRCRSETLGIEAEEAQARRVTGADATGNAEWQAAREWLLRRRSTRHEASAQQLVEEHHPKTGSTYAEEQA